jgi:hypothetical protein
LIVKEPPEVLPESKKGSQMPYPTTRGRPHTSIINPPWRVVRVDENTQTKNYKNQRVLQAWPSSEDSMVPYRIPCRQF